MTPPQGYFCWWIGATLALVGMSLNNTACAIVGVVICLASRR